jgi:hypothetical protein
MHQLLHNSKYIAILANLVFFVTVFYGKLIYNKKFKARRVHYLMVTFGLTMVVYYPLLLIYSIAFMLNNKPLYALACLSFIASPYIIGIFGNNYDRAKTYFNIQLVLLVMCFVFLAMAI